ncbi:MAG: YjbQ family protein [Syntrophomonadaceae bacterium]|nr:YjbQ family protein [Syntrophomonadaceae bacterium]
MDSFVVRTRSRNELIDITQEVKRIVSGSGVRNGLVTVFVPHTTAAVTINENADPSVVHDLLTGLSDLAPANLPKYRHAEGNSDAHIKASLLGASETLIISEGNLVLGTWQGIYFCEFDGPRTRSVHVQVIKG